MSGAATAFALASPEDLEPPKPEPGLNIMNLSVCSEVSERIVEEWLDTYGAEFEAPEEQSLTKPLPEAGGEVLEEGGLAER
ncbi:hypothetical protein MY11210_004391 [Beauveria gryllotalpidicola]